MSAESGRVDLADIAAAAEAVRALGAPYLLIGGNALVVLGLGAGTYDIDIGIRRRDFLSLADRLRALGWNVEVQGNAIGASRDGDALELIHPGPFGPTDDPDSFFDYVLAHASVDTEHGPTARPHVVWYMRLCFEPEMGRQKILQDARLNMPDAAGVLAEVLTLAAEMGRLEQVRPHLEWVRARL